jgi:dephospho-CoA kinase
MRRRVEEWASSGSGRRGLRLLEGALLIELGLDGLTDAVVVVACDEETCVRRSMERDGIGEDVARGRIAAQLPLTRRLERADWVLSNHGGAPLWNLQSQAQAVFSRLAADSKTEE